ncbi:hypothetical protein ACIBSU_37220 [Streptomyces lydicus]|uniref:ISAzo13-like element transposase-related protein n=1 Tax=Streptomyces lydicus TaxID=47763 RepID=UPI0037A7F279
MRRTIAATTSRIGLTVHAELDSREYPTDIRISNHAIAALPITRHRLEGDRNYTFHPTDHQECTDFPRPRGPSANGSDCLTPDDLRHPELTGMAHKQLSDRTPTLIPGLEERREQVRHAARGGPVPRRPRHTPQTYPRSRRPDSGHHPLPADTRFSGAPRPALQHRWPAGCRTLLAPWAPQIRRGSWPEGTTA